ncbi:MAG: Glucokinase [Chlamydiae bacterium]|nr:Glucokinase [Chlamydiota bacterium]
MKRVILGGDIGGTKTHLALFEKNEKRSWVVDAKYKSSDYENLRSIVLGFLAKYSDYEIERACFGIAGPVQDGICKATNLPWIVDAAEVSEATGIPSVSLINDLEANAYGISCLEEEEFFCLNEGKAKIGNAALIAAGTGLGEAGMFWDGEKIHPFACEGGHCGFAPENSLEIELLIYMFKKYDHVSFERVLSGPALYDLYRFLIDEGHEKELDAVKKAFRERPPPRVITEMGMNKSCPACKRALGLFVSIYGNEAANLALKILAVGGVYLGGGIAPKILGALKEGDFMKRFVKKGRFSSLLLDIPVKVILNENTAMLGAAYYARNR